MKKYLSVAVVLGAIAFVSVSYLAQANEAMPVTTKTTETTTTTTTTTTDQTDAAVQAAKDCETSVNASFEGKMPTDADREAALKACVDAKIAGGVAADEDSATTIDDNGGEDQ